MKIKKGIIKNFQGSWGSGLGMLIIDDEKDGTVLIPCDNGPTVRALENAFGNVIGNSHNVKKEAGYKNKEIFYCYDEMGLCLSGFVPIDMADPEVEEAYQKQFK